MKFEINPKSVLISILIFIIFLLIANLAGVVSTYYFKHDSVYGLVPLFNFTLENNIPTLYSSVALIMSSFLLAVIAIGHIRQNEPYIAWFGLSIIFLFLSVDETASIHEKLIDPVRDSLDLSGLLYYSWVIPYDIALIALVVLYTRFLLRLGKNIRILFIVSGAIFITGAIGLELLGGLQHDLHGVYNIKYQLISTCEELFEMLGVMIFIYALLSYIEQKFGKLTISTMPEK